jgi:molybdenum cofactor cytidylyltransferase
MSGTLAIAILAAGTGERFGGAKLDRELAGKRLGAFAVQAALPLGLPRIVVGKPVPQFALDAMACGEAQILKNTRASDGIGTSVALAALQAGAAGADALLLLAADMPQVTSATLQRLAEAVAPGRPAAVVYTDGSPGIPACFPADWFGKLAGLDGDKGAGALLREAPAVTRTKVPPAELSDVDTSDDLAAIAARHRL